MRRYVIVSGILLILPVIDFALAAPVLVQEKRQASVDVLNIPRDEVTVLGKRGNSELENLLDEYFKGMGKPAESSDAHASSSPAPPGPDHGLTNVVQAPVPDPALSDAHGSSSSAPPGPDHGSTNVVQTPAPNLASATFSPKPSVEPLSSPAPIDFESSALSDSEDYEWLFQPEDDDKIHTATSSGHGLDHELNSVPTGTDHGSTDVVQAPPPNPASPTANPNPLVEWSSSEPSPASSSTLSDSEFQWLIEPEGDRKHRIINFLPPNPNKRPWTDMEPELPDPDFDWAHWTAYVNRPSASPEEIGQTSEHQAEHVQQPDQGPWILDSGSDSNYFPMPVSVAHPPSTNAELQTGPEHEGNPGSSKEPEYDVTDRPPSNPESTDPELPLDNQSTDSQEMDPQAAAIYAAKGKAKQLRRIPGTTRDVGNAAQRELQPDKKVA